MDRDTISKIMREMGRKGGKKGGPKGGKARMASLTPEERSAFARRGAQARWAKTKSASAIQKKKRRSKAR